MAKPLAQLIYEFESFRLDASQRMLSRDGEEVALPPKVVETLLVLVEHRGRIVSKEELLEAVWRGDIVEDSNLYGYLHILRNTLGDQQCGKPFIETLHRRGYRFNGEVRVIQQDAAREYPAVPIDDVSGNGVSAEEQSDTHVIHRDRRVRYFPKAAVGAASVIVVILSAFAVFLVSGKRVKAITDRDLTNSEEAYALYIKGNDLAQRLTPESFQQAIQHFDDAIALDPYYPSPYVGIATACRVNMLSTDAPPKDRLSMANGKLAAVRAVELAPDLAEAHIALGMITFFYEWNWQAAEEQLRKGYELNPDIEDTNIQLAHFYSNMGRHDEAVALGARAQRIDPLINRSGALYGMILFYAGQYDESIKQLNARIEFKPDFWLNHLFLQRPYLEKGLYTDAIHQGELARQKGGKSLELIFHRAYAYSRMGETKKADDALAELNEVAKNGYVGPYLLALTHNVLGDKEQALNFLDKAYEVKDWRMTFLKVDPRWINLRSEPRFAVLMGKMKFE